MLNRMRFRDANRSMNYFGLVLMASLVTAIQYYQDLHNARVTMHFKQIPKKFEIRGRGAVKEFKKYFDEIERIAKDENITVLYKVRLDAKKPIKTVEKVNKKSMPKKFKSKKYNIPLKKNSMKLSNFEVMLRKMAEQSIHGTQNQNYEKSNNKSAATTESDRRIMSTKQIQLKYKPIISKVKTNYTKRIKPVRKKFITLTR